MGRLQVRMLGKFEVCRDDRPLAGFEGRRLQEFFCYLLLRRDRPQPRESLAEFVAAGATPDQSRKTLRQALWQIQTALAPTDSHADEGAAPAAQHGRLLVVDPDWVHVNTEADFWLDVAEFEQCFAPVVGRPGESLDTEAAGRLTGAIGLYRGELLEGCYQDWCLLERERLQNNYLAMLDKLMGYCAAHGEYEQGAEYGGAILRIDRARERTHQRLMQLYYLAGDRTAALRQYERCSAALEEELGVQPSRRTAQLYQQIRSEALDAPSSTQESSTGSGDPRAGAVGAAGPANPSTHAAGRSDVVETVQDLQASFHALADLQMRITRDLDVLVHWASDAQL